MFEGLKRFANDLFDFDDAKDKKRVVDDKDEGTMIKNVKHHPTKSNQIKFKGKMVNGMYVTPSNLWDAGQLDVLYSEVKLRKKFDIRFLKGVRKHGKTKNYPSPNMKMIMEFAENGTHITLMNESLALQESHKLKIWHDLSTDFLVNHFDKFKTPCTVSVIVRNEASFYPWTIKNRDISSIDNRVNQLVEWKNVIREKFAKDSGKNRGKFERSFKEVEHVDLLN